MASHIPEILSQENFTTLVNWLATDGQPEPEFSNNFLTTLNAIYMQKEGVKPLTRPHTKASTTLSIRALIEEVERERSEQKPAVKIKQPQQQNPVMEELTNIVETTKTNHSRLDDGRLPLRNDDGYTENDANSLLFADAIAYCWSQLENKYTNGRPISQSFLQMTLYIIYGTVLAQRQSRLFAEHPQMWKYGPVFAKVYNRIAKAGIYPDDGAFLEIRKKDPVIAEFIQRIVGINARQKMKDLVALHMSESSPWGRCLKANPDKWSTPLDDKEIERWFKKNIDKK